ncbi:MULTISPECIES: ABC transporter substrate-binding protein [unclassified Coleofasciculus]|uniref:ABC transporter substrate-binding protein n=1 Tax=unclassified Coleofasciculus TaxID=2692782 RepID=UPI0018815231|nr:MULTISPECIES: ABC transporter substrate-binding protein [unclassified Coleofasciculus]MBE9124884.1 ABC transporter substrate-binding protein [Coleofasciculus sp. LEGE 07081]MBE9147872.1 ABC transporter substrate-binding protein [Coleofasciculus sp. LEGE 07092]
MMQSFRKRITLKRLLLLVALFQILVLFVLFLNRPPIHLSWLVPADEATSWQTLIDDFEAKNPKIKVDLRTKLNLGGFVTYQLREEYMIDCRSGNSFYDLIYTDIIWVPELAAQGCLRDLSQWTNRKELIDEKGFIESQIRAGVYDDKLYRLPLRSEIGLLYYRKDLVGEDIESLETFQELVDLSKKLRSQGKSEWHYLWQGWRYEGLVAVFFEVLKGYGGFWIDPKTLQVGLDEQAAINAVNFLISTIKENISPLEVVLYSEADSLEEFQQGNGVFLRNWPNVWKKVNSEDPKAPLYGGKVGVKPMRLHVAGVDGVSCNGSWGLGIAKNSKYPKKAWKFIEYLTSQDVQKNLVLESGFLPSREALFKDKDLVDKYEHLPKLLEAVKTSVLRPPIPQYSEASLVLQQYLSQALRQQLNHAQVEVLMRKAAKETRELLRNPPIASIQ